MQSTILCIFFMRKGNGCDAILRDPPKIMARHRKTQRQEKLIRLKIFLYKISSWAVISLLPLHEKLALHMHCSCMCSARNYIII
jgi:hypothetical protein